MNKLNYIRHIILSCLFLLLCLPSVSLSVIYKITDNTYFDGYPSLYNGTIAWEGNPDDLNSEIYYWDGAETYQIPAGKDDDYMPSLSNGSITWEKNGDIYFWNGATDATTNMTDNDDLDTEPSLSNGKIAWTSESASGTEVYFLDNTDGTATPAPITTGSQGYPSVSLYETTIAWDSTEVGDDYEIYYRDDAEIIRQITDNTSQDWYPSLYNGKIAWQSDIDGDSEIYYWDGTKIDPITDNTSEDSYPSLYNGKIAWQSDIDGDSEIYYWDGGSRVLVNAGSDQKVTTCDISLDGTNTFDPDEVIDSWAWLLEYRGDPSKKITATGETATVSSLVDGIYDVTLTVTDNVGEEATDTMLLEVDHNPWDVDNDCRKGLAEVISILQELTGQ